MGFVLSLILALFITVVNTELILLQVLYRHGDRSPTRIYPNSPHKESSWPQGLGELTKIGKEQEFELGQLLRKKYGDDLQFLDKTFNVRDVYVRSTDFDRTLMSAYCMLAGLFPPTINQTWNTNIKWQPIPVHTVPLLDDNVVYNDNPCPTFTRKMDYFMTHDPEVLRVKKENQDLIKYVSRNAGVPATFEGMLSITDQLYIEGLYNMSQPDWLLKDETFVRLIDLRNYNARWWNPTHEMGVLKGGFLLKKMYEDMLMKLNQPENLTQRMLIYSAHDSTVAALLKTMKIFPDKIPPYSSCVMIELYRNRTVRILYRNDTYSKQIYPLILPGCKEFCPIEEFHDILNDSMPGDRNKACGITDPIHASFRRHMLGYTVMGLLIFLLLILTITTCCLYQRQTKQYRYMELSTDITDMKDM